MYTFKNQRVLITGASSGIGRAIALLLAEQGTRLILVARDEAKLQNVVNEIISSCPEIPAPIIFFCDVSDINQVKQMVKDCIDLTGGIDILINNAGIGIYGEFFLYSERDFHQIMDVNFFGAVHCVQEILPHMVMKGKGKIINIASLAAIHGIPYLSAYGSSKAALAVFSQSLQAELYNTGIQVKVIYPGYTDTEFFAKEKKVGKAKRPKSRYEPPQEVARKILKSINKSNGSHVYTLKGKLLSILHAFSPGLLDYIMKRYAIRLKH
jgi:short-subunit dehydrogenase